MANKRDLSPEESPIKFCGACMRNAREEAGLTLADLSLRVFQGESYLAMIERGERRLQPALGEQLDRLYGKKDKFFENFAKAILNSTGHAEYFADAADQERHAETITEYQPALIPGMLQTEAYARVLIDGDNPYRPEEERHRLLAARLERAKLLDRAEVNRPCYWAVVPEWVIRANFGGPAVMEEQLHHLIAQVRARRTVFQIFPQSATVPPAVGHTMELMTFPDTPSLAYFEGGFTGQLIDEPSIVARCLRAYDVIKGAALSPEASLELIESAVKGLKK
ncbi:helix-turn-helix domain-containing protein [Streptomyces sp. 4N509B]|uniref:helix-turn-helix domain-containing protein n=1 Tax=Streptomyces sp. 4N509B TaxID=3457413 RepID=UPI003FD05AE7